MKSPRQTDGTNWLLPHTKDGCEVISAPSSTAPKRFAAAFAPKTRWGLFLRNQVISAFAIPGFARLTVGGDITDTLQLPVYNWPARDASAV